MRVYLCGAINGCTDSQCNDWREYAKKHLNAETVDPMRRDYRGREDECVKQIVELDKEDIAASHIVLVNASRPSWGTAMEVLFAWNRCRQIVAFVGDGPIGPWLRYHCAHITRSLEDAVSWINDSLSRKP